MSTQLKDLIEAQSKDLKTARDYHERANGGELSVEERTAWDALNVQMDERGENIDGLLSDAKRQKRIDEARAFAPESFGDDREQRDGAPVENVAAILRDIATRKLDGHVFETRAVSTTGTAGGYTIPEGFGGRIIEKMLTVGPMLNDSVVNLVRTDSLQAIPFPIENARAAGSANTEATAWADSSPTFTTKTLASYKYGSFVLASEELLLSEDVGLTDYLARNMGIAVGTAVNSILTLGTGTVQPEGVSAGAGSAVTGGTAAGDGKATYADLVDLVHAVDSLYASQPTTGFMMRRTSLANIRKITDTAGHYIFNERANLDTPSTIFGYPVYENPYVAATATNAVSILFGDFSYCLVRQAGGIEVKRSDEFKFDTDQVAFKVRTWVDSFVGQSDAIKYFKGGTA